MLLGMAGVGYVEMGGEGILLNYSPGTVTLRVIKGRIEEMGVGVRIINKNDSLFSNTKEF